VACYLDLPVSGVVIKSIQDAATTALIGEAIKTSEDCNTRVPARACPAASRRLAELAEEWRAPTAAAAGGAELEERDRRLQESPLPDSSPRSDLRFNVIVAVTLRASDGSYRNDVRRAAILAATSTDEGRAELNRFLIQSGFYDALLEFDPSLPVTRYAEAGTLMVSSAVLPSQPAQAAPAGSSNVAAVAGGIGAAVIILAVLGGAFWYLKQQQARDPAAQLHNQASYAKAPKAVIEMGAGLTGGNGATGGMNPAYARK